MYRSTILGLLSSMTFAVLVTGCDSPGMQHKAKAPTQSGQQAVGQATTNAGPVPEDAFAKSGIGAQTPSLAISDEIVKACGIQGRADGKPTASFDFDSAALMQEDRDMLALVAKCLTDGPLQGKQVSLIGRADPRGEGEYNMTLGSSRSDAVNRYMRDLGVARDHLHTTSRGELDATGTNEDGWKKDRRVDIELMK